VACRALGDHAGNLVLGTAEGGLLGGLVLAGVALFESDI
jgi:hypothetical protein